MNVLHSNGSIISYKYKWRPQKVLAEPNAIPKAEILHAAVAKATYPTQPPTLTWSKNTISRKYIWITLVNLNVKGYPEEDPNRKNNHKKDQMLKDWKSLKILSLKCLQLSKMTFPGWSSKVMIMSRPMLLTHSTISLSLSWERPTLRKGILLPSNRLILWRNSTAILQSK